MSTKEEHLLRDVRSLVSAIQRLTVEKEEYVKDINSLWRQEREERANAVKRADAVRRRFLDEFDSLSRDIEYLKERKDYLFNEVSSLEEVGKRNAVVTGIHTDKLDSLLGTSKDIKTEIRSLESARNKITSDIDLLSLRKSSLAKEVSILESNRGEFESKLAELNRNISFLLKDEERLQERVHEVQTKRDVWVEDILTDHNKRLEVRRNRLTGMNMALDETLAKKQKEARAPN